MSHGWADPLSGSYIDLGVIYAKNAMPDEIEATIGATATNEIFFRLRLDYQRGET